MPRIISGINAVRENLSRDKGVVEVFVARGRKIERLKEILELARRKGIPIRAEDRIYLDKLSSGRPHQGIVGILGTYRYFQLEDLVRISQAEEATGFLLAADHITDTGNLGSLVRTAVFFGVQGLILPVDRSASVTDAVHRISAGGSAFLPVARVVNMARTLKQLADQGFWVVGAAGESATSIYEFDWNRNLILVLGSEDKGLSRIVRNQCHHLVSIPSFGHLDSLNVSVAGGVILSEIVKQRRIISK
jgi:23S rRNA (guanosine2251-2'-O)-methyltransferase